VYGGKFGYWTEILMEVNFTVCVQILHVIYHFILRDVLFNRMHFCGLFRYFFFQCLGNTTSKFYLMILTDLHNKKLNK